MRIFEDQYLSTVIILFTQFVFIYLRTINVIYTAERRIVPAIITGNGIGLAWLVSISIGANSMINGEVIPIIAYLIGGSVGTYIGIKGEKKKHDGKK
jgi:uncharacterized protein YebE (UPF0316 family)